MELPNVGDALLRRGRLPGLCAVGQVEREQGQPDHPGGVLHADGTVRTAGPQLSVLAVRQQQLLQTGRVVNFFTESIVNRPDLFSSAGMLQRTDRLDNVQPKFSNHRGHRGGIGATVGDIPRVLPMQVNRKVPRYAAVKRIQTLQQQHAWNQAAREQSIL